MSLLGSAQIKPDERDLYKILQIKTNVLKRHTLQFLHLYDTKKIGIDLSHSNLFRV